MIFNNRLVLRKAKSGDLKPVPAKEGAITRENVEAKIQAVDLIVKNLCEKMGLFQMENTWTDKKGLVGQWATVRRELADKASACLRREADASRAKAAKRLVEEAGLDPAPAYGDSTVRLAKSRFEA